MVLRLFLHVLYIIIALNKGTPKKVENSGNDAESIVTQNGLSTLYSLGRKIGQH